MNISVLITVKNVKSTIEKCLDSLTNQDFKGKYNIVIVDSLSTDGTQEILKKYSKKYNWIKVVEYKCSQPEALNYAVKNKLVARDIVALIDGDCVADKKWLKNIVKNIKEGKEMVGGICLTPKDAGFLQRLIGYDLDYRFLSTKKGYVKRHPNMNLAMKREILEKIKFDEKLLMGYDTEFGYRLNKLNKKIWFDPEIKVEHYHRASIKSYTKQQINSGKYALLAYKKIGGIKTDNINPWWMIYQPVFFILTIVFLLFSIFFNEFLTFSLVSFLILNLIMIYHTLKEFFLFKKIEVFLVYFLYWYRLLFWHIGAFFGLFNIFYK